MIKRKEVDKWECDGCIFLEENPTYSICKMSFDFKDSEGNDDCDDTEKRINYIFIEEVEDD